MPLRPRVLITRPGERALPLLEAIAARGAQPDRLDVMRQEPLEETQAMRNAWLDFDQFDKVVVVSPFAAECLAEALDRYWPQLPIGPQYYAVGRATADTLHSQLGVRVRVPPATGEDTSEALLAMASLRHLEGSKVLLVAGEGGRELLADTLVARGARLTRLALYRRVLIPLAGPSLERLASGDYAALVVSSGEILEHLAGWCTSTALHQPLIVSSQRLVTLAKEWGFADIHVARGATPAALADAVAETCRLARADADHDDLEKG
ncbi:uroporphyrinogen-III synthase [Litchfieldella xinjiangensis]|uniref:uroporphyrinogen-III synthase n=1 Tax=Litchfieldella xinjiangensis TaxID=1166948 RepID=UPI0005B78024|nr:uroporphyrinogen-III synthase [Halomonas xinjiangensis]